MITKNGLIKKIRWLRPVQLLGGWWYPPSTISKLLSMIKQLPDTEVLEIKTGPVPPATVIIGQWGGHFPGIDVGYFENGLWRRRSSHSSGFYLRTDHEPPTRWVALDDVIALIQFPHHEGKKEQDHVG